MFKYLSKIFLFVTLLTPVAFSLSCHSCEYIMDNGVIKGDASCLPETPYELSASTLKPCELLRNPTSENENQTHLLTCVQTVSHKDESTKVKRSCFVYSKVIWGAEKDESSNVIARCQVVTKDESSRRDRAAISIWPYVRGAGDNNLQWSDNDIEACFCNDKAGCNLAGKNRVNTIFMFLCMWLVSARMFV